ncbi:hypothetical protein [Listeria booriae]|uniref:hypothetical protein n=1 Tax=Listeria booriae TaxID=1552123 RepID=UPI001628F60A|nr:hypothetical protein [Listeria booriae]MBC2148137.1 hypothetical protein [Listeria booriae]
MLMTLLFVASLIAIITFTILSFRKKNRDRNLTYLAVSIVAMYVFWVSSVTLSSFAGYAFWFVGLLMSLLFLLNQLGRIKIKKMSAFTINLVAILFSVCLFFSAVSYAEQPSIDNSESVDNSASSDESYADDSSSQTDSYTDDTTTYDDDSTSDTEEDTESTEPGDDLTAELETSFNKLITESEGLLVSIEKFDDSWDHVRVTVNGDITYEDEATKQKIADTYGPEVRSRVTGYMNKVGESIFITFSYPSQETMAESSMLDVNTYKVKDK